MPKRNLSRDLLLFLLLLLNVQSSDAQSCDVCATSEPINIGLIACYPLNGNGIDESGNNRNGADSGLTANENRMGQPNAATYFNGSSSYTSTSSTPFQVNTYTYSLWVKLDSIPVNNIYSLISVGGTIGDQMIFVSNYNGQLGFGYSSYYGSSATPNTYFHGSLPVVGNWYHIVLTRTTTTLKFYINGVLLNSRSVGSVNARYAGSNLSTVMGARVGSPTSQYLKGTLDDIRFYNRELTLEEVTQLSGTCQVCSDTDVTQINIYDTTRITITDTLYTNLNVYDTTRITITDTLYTNLNVYDTIRITITDTLYTPVTVYDTIRIAVTDTLIIDVVTGLNPTLNLLSSIKIYPNPSHDYILIDNGNYTSLSGYSLKITNSLGQSVYNNTINQQQLTVSTQTLGGTGTYFIQIIDPSNHIIETRKLIIR